MRELNLVPCQPRPWRVTTVPDPAASNTPDLVRRDFTTAAPGEKMVGDITYIHTWEGWVYLATVIDCHTKKIIGWSMADHLKASLACDAMTMAASNMAIPDDAIFHSDRGVQYTSSEFHRVLRPLGIRSSVGRTGVCWDNALAESVNASVKNELVHRTVFPTREQARRAIVKYIEGFCNQRRLHSGLDYKTPHEVHIEYLKRHVAA